MKGRFSVGQFELKWLLTKSHTVQSVLDSTGNRVQQGGALGVVRVGLRGIPGREKPWSGLGDVKGSDTFPRATHSISLEFLKNVLLRI